MTHLTELQCGMFADGALAGAESDAVVAHLASCVDCHARLAALREESAMIRAALSRVADVEVPATPTFRRPLSLGTFAIANIGTGLVVWLAQFLWKTLFGELVINLAADMTALYVPNAYELTVDTAMYFYIEGTAMIDAYLGFIVTGLLVLTAAWATVVFRRARGMASICVLAMLGAGLAVPGPAHALEIRKSDGVTTVAAGETIDDTLMIAGETVVVDGTVNGDVFAAGRRIVIDGLVTGNVFAFGSSVTIDGEVGGLTMGAGSSLELSDAKVGGDFWGAGERVSIRGDTTIAGNASVGAETAVIEGRVGRDVTVAVEVVELSGSVGGDLEAFAGRVNLLRDATLEGNLRFRTRDEDRLDQSPGATVQGQIEFLAPLEQFEAENRYLRPNFYAGQLLALVAAFIAGFVFLWLLPELREVTLEGGVDGLKTAGIGLVTLVSVPLISLLVAVTLVGLPITVVGFVAWGIAIYLSKIVVAAFVGQMLLSGGERRDSLALALLAGLGIVYVAINIPAIGGVIRFILTIVGMGMITRVIFDYVRDLERP